jgi:hypothetical protein
LDEARKMVDAISLNPICRRTCARCSTDRGTAMFAFRFPLGRRYLFLNSSQQGMQ